ncbi:unnamed protein product [Cylicocyclus nassatus]|uniref:Uncharacterized protein n=1 Tax=Cylicocyclus nassatus TaxID=53992 RepID=A0AA36GY73_CYLNA|nr:unnamed protein product [Cylicocyclus nassatus]
MKCRLKRPRIYYAFLITVVTLSLCIHFLVPPTRKPEKILSSFEFYKLLVDKYGPFRILDEICVEENCYVVRDALANPLIMKPFERQLLQTKPPGIRAIALLQAPTVRVASNTDSSKWMIVRDKVVDGSLDFMMLEAAIMSGGLSLDTNASIKVLIVGLGSGTLANFIHFRWPSATLIGLERKVEFARFVLEWFQIYHDYRLKIYGVVPSEKIAKLAKEGATFNVVFFNVCSMSYHSIPCPSIEDLSEATIERVAEMIGHTGAFVINLMTNGVDATAVYEQQKHRLERHFNCILLKSKATYNSVLSCSKRMLNINRTYEINKFLRQLTTISMG